MKSENCPSGKVSEGFFAPGGDGAAPLRSEARVI
jgi:hypothetical protein